MYVGHTQYKEALKGAPEIVSRHKNRNQVKFLDKQSPELIETYCKEPSYKNAVNNGKSGPFPTICFSIYYAN